MIFSLTHQCSIGHLNPKFTKWIHRNVFPCCFGRDCLIPNLGYTSEAAAFYMDQRLGLGIVPGTHIVKLASPVFSYPYQDRWSHVHRGKPLPQKMGSFQLFVKGFEDASSFFYRGYEMLKNPGLHTNDSREPLLNSNGGPNLTQSASSLSRASSADWTDESRRLFRLNFERMVVLDYLIRQTDRGMDNWMIKKADPAVADSHDPSISIAAIDNGLAFPYKHPDSIRSYPYGWSFLPLANIPFSPETGYQILCYLTSHEWWEETVKGLHAIFSLDRDFSVCFFALPSRPSLLT
jgi:phosphatidylinositol 4-kinase type 2